MRFELVEIANFRKLTSTRVDFAKKKTVFVGANNSGKTTAMVALRTFLVARERRNFSLYDFTLSHWQAINAIGKSWEVAHKAQQPLPTSAWGPVLPFIDIWIHVETSEVHFVQKILPSLDWTGGRLGLRLRLEPKELETLQKDYLSARDDTDIPIEEANTSSDIKADAPPTVSLWPQNLTEFLHRRLNRYFEVKSYVLDPAKLREPAHGHAMPQEQPESEPLDDDPLHSLVKINEISAQRGFGQSEHSGSDDEDEGEASSSASTRKLGAQLQGYYRRHLDPYDKPDAHDLKALQAIEVAQKEFDNRLKEGFASALKEMNTLGYPGVSNPQLSISTRVRPVDGLNHDAAVQYAIPFGAGPESTELKLPEESNGLGYQNLISMVFKLMSYRDAWMRVGKAKAKTSSSENAFIPPLHLVLVEEPEAHLHTQVQQAFIRRAYDVLRNHKDLGEDTRFTTQLIVSTHSSHIAHECEFSSLRYFRRLPVSAGEIPASCVVNLTTVFGEEDETKRFVTRYLKVTHCDLFFADAAVLIEGPAERLLVPHFVRQQSEFKYLADCYVTWLEIGGSHAHRLRSLIEKIGLTTLVITDLDAIGEDGRNAPPKRGAKQTSRNATLKLWHPGFNGLDELLNTTEEAKQKNYKEQALSMRVAYQQPVEISFKSKTCEAIANTLEDALVFENLDLFLKLDGGGLIAKFKASIRDCSSVEELGHALWDHLKSGGKAELALDLLDLKDAAALKPPTYIAEGLRWLSGQLRRNQVDLGLPVPAIPTKDQAKAV